VHGEDLLGLLVRRPLANLSAQCHAASPGGSHLLQGQHRRPILRAPGARCTRVCQACRPQDRRAVLKETASGAKNDRVERKKVMSLAQAREWRLVPIEPPRKSSSGSAANTCVLHCLTKTHLAHADTAAEDRRSCAAGVGSYCAAISLAEPRAFLSLTSSPEMNARVKRICGSVGSAEPLTNR
jgi:hypothetical protein